MKTEKLNRKIRYTRMVLQDSLIELMKLKPIAKITVKELCENADVNRTTFYAHFTDPLDLLRKIEDETLSWAEEMISSILRQTDKREMLKVLEGVFQYIMDNKKHIQVLMSEKGNIDFQKQLMTMIYKQCDIASLITRNSELVSKEYYYIFVVNGSIGLIQHWLKDGLGKSPREMAEIIMNLASQIR